MQICRFSNSSDCRYKVPKKPIISIYNENCPCVDLSYHSIQQKLQNWNHIKTIGQIVTSPNIVLNIWVKVFKNGPSKICGRQPLKNLKEHGLQTTNFT